jgi:DNA (cytosine-5)-methyltransferase 1
MSKISSKIRIVDLFSGVGGLTFGFQYKILNNELVKNDLFEIVFANEYNPKAAEAFRLNFNDIKVFETSIENIDEKYLINEEINYKNIDIVIGGPPCQSYSTVGKRKKDNRSRMYVEYQRLLEIIKPKMFIFENVLGILSFKLEDGTNIIDEIIKQFDNIGYSVQRKILNAKDYSIPQNRKRVFLVGIRKDFGLIWKFPDSNTETFLTVSDAISDLPVIKSNESINKYSAEPITQYQRLLRSNQNELTDHFCGIYGERITQIIANLDDGESKVDINRKVLEGMLPNNLLLTSGYNNSYGRLWWDMPSSTITNNFATPSAIRCIHPHQNRALTIREAARIQSFPDWFVFVGSKADKCSQVGNAVPPLLAIALANQVIATLTEDNNGK